MRLLFRVPNSVLFMDMEEGLRFAPEKAKKGKNKRSQKDPKKKNGAMTGAKVSFLQIVA
jgi:hypothetical protein